MAAEIVVNLTVLVALPPPLILAYIVPLGGRSGGSHLPQLFPAPVQQTNPAKPCISACESLQSPFRVAALPGQHDLTGAFPSPVSVIVPNLHVAVQVPALRVVPTVAQVDAVQEPPFVN